MCLLQKHSSLLQTSFNYYILILVYVFYTFITFYFSYYFELIIGPQGIAKFQSFREVLYRKHPVPPMVTHYIIIV